MSSYVGYIVRNGDTNPFKVYIPALSGGTAGTFKTADGFGTNAGKWGADVLAMMEAGAVDCYQTSALRAKNTYDFNPQNGLATVENNLGELNEQTATTVEAGRKAALKTSRPVDDGPLRMGCDMPAANFSRVYRPSSADSTFLPSMLNMPGGSYTSLSAGTRVLVNYPGGGAIGYIISQLPGTDAFSEFIKDPTKEV